MSKECVRVGLAAPRAAVCTPVLLGGGGAAPAAVVRVLGAGRAQARARKSGSTHTCAHARARRVGTWKIVRNQPGGEKLVAVTRILHRTAPDELMVEVRCVCGTLLLCCLTSWWWRCAA